MLFQDYERNYDQLGVLDGLTHAEAEWDKRVDYEIDVPLDYWQAGADLIPSQAQSRVAQLKRFQTLFDGDYGYKPVKINYHQMTAQFLADLLMSMPPRLVRLQDGQPTQAPYESDFITPRFVQMAHESLYNVLVDMIRFGTGLFHLMEGEWGAEVSAPMPVYWYPADSKADVLATMQGEDRVVLDYSYADGQTRQQVWSVTGMKLDRLVEEESVMPIGSAAHWDIIQRSGIGRAGSIIPVQRRPSTGDWGRSLYRDITSLALDINRRFSAITMILNHDRPRLKLIPAMDNERTGDVADDPSQSDESLLRSKTRQLRLEEWAQAEVLTPPVYFDDIQTLERQGTLQDHFTHIEEDTKQMFAATNIPAALYGIGIEKHAISGKAVKEQYKRTYVYALSAQTTTLPRYKKLMMAAASLEGASTADLQQMNDEMGVVWPNPFDQDENVSQVEIGDEGAGIGDESDLTADLDTRAQELV